MLSNLTIVPEGEVDARLLPALAAIDKPTTLGFLNAHGVNLCWDRSSVARNFTDLDYLLRDGIGVDLCCRRLGWKGGENLNGTDFIPRLLQHRGGTISVLGTQAPWLEVAAQRLRDRGAKIVSAHHGFERPDFYVNQVLADRPDVVLLAMGMPKQEEVAALIKEAADWPVLIICGGAILDWISERFERAPEFYRRNNLEWVYRLRKEPARLFRRYVIGNPLMILRLPAMARVVNRDGLQPKGPPTL